MHRDLWNEPDNSGYTSELITPLITQVFEWARGANPTQPLTSPLWQLTQTAHMSELEQVQYLFVRIFIGFTTWY